MSALTAPRKLQLDSVLMEIFRLPKIMQMRQPRLDKQLQVRLLRRLLLRQPNQNRLANLRLHRLRRLLPPLSLSQLQKLRHHHR